MSIKKKLAEAWERVVLGSSEKDQQKVDEEMRKAAGEAEKDK